MKNIIKKILPVKYKEKIKKISQIRIIWHP